jgi:hypothetical protein
MSMEKIKTIPIVPREKVLCNDALYLAFNNCGCGHYDAVVESVKQVTNTDEEVCSTETSEHKGKKRLPLW